MSGITKATDYKEPPMDQVIVEGPLVMRFQATGVDEEAVRAQVNERLTSFAPTHGWHVTLEVRPLAERFGGEIDVWEAEVEAVGRRPPGHPREENE